MNKNTVLIILLILALICAFCSGFLMGGIFVFNKNSAVIEFLEREENLERR